MKIRYQSRSAQSDRAFVICCDADFLPFACFLGERLQSASEKSNVDICIVSLDEMPKDAIERLHRVRFIHIDTEDIFKGQHMPGRLGESAFLRLIIPELLGDNYHRIAYLDCDIYSTGENIGEIFDFKLGGRPLAAVRDLKQWFSPRYVPKEFKAMGWGSGRYFNSGVLLIDTNTFRVEDVLKKCLDFGREHGNKMPAHDQSLLNCVLRDLWAEIPPVWNWQIAAFYPYFHQIVAPRFIHFVSHAKPWDSRKNGGIPPEFVATYALYLETHFKNVGRVTWAAEGRHYENFDVWRRLWKHVAKTPALLRYTNSFRGDMDIH